MPNQDTVVPGSEDVNNQMIPSQDDGAEGVIEDASATPGEETLSDYARSQVEAERKKYAGLDRKHSLLQRQFELLRQGATAPNQSAQADGEGYGYQEAELAARLAEYQLKDGVRDILEQFGEDVPQAVKSAVLRNPRGFISLDAKDVSSALLEIESYLSEVVDSEQAPTATQARGLQGKFVAPNATTPATKSNGVKTDIGSMSEDELAEALDSGRLTDKDLEAFLRTQGK